MERDFEIETNFSMNDGKIPGQWITAAERVVSRDFYKTKGELGLEVVMLGKADIYPPC